MQNEVNDFQEQQQNKLQNRQQTQQRQKKDYRNVMIVSLLVIMCFMSVSYAVLSTNKQNNRIVTYVAQEHSDVRISTISSVTTKGDGVDVKSLISSKNEVTLYPSITSEEDEVTYTINVFNDGNAATTLNDIYVRGNNDKHLSYSINNLNAGDILYAHESHMFTITIKYNEDYTGDLNYDDDNVSEIILSLNYD